MELSLGLKLSQLRVVSATEAEMFSDPGFDNSGVWSISNDGATISGSKVTSNGTESATRVHQTAEVSLTSSNSYDFSIDIESYTIGNIRFFLYENGTANYQFGAYKSGTGTKTDTLVHDGLNTYDRIGIQFTSSAEMTCDNISCVEQ